MIRSFMGKAPWIVTSAVVDKTAVPSGDVEIGEGSDVPPVAVFRGDMGKIRIKKQTIVEDNRVILSGEPELDTGNVNIGNRVTIGHGAALHCRTVGSNVLIGMNATILHGA